MLSKQKEPPLKLISQWSRFWIRVARVPYCCRMATSLALLGAPPPMIRKFFATLDPRGWVDPRATLWGPTIRLGLNGYIDKRVEIYQENHSGPVEVGDRVCLYEDTHIFVGQGGSLQIGPGSDIHRGCQIESYKEPIQIGSRVGISAGCTTSFVRSRQCIDPTLCRSRACVEWTDHH